MDNRVRDLDQIQEFEGDEQERKFGTIVLAALAIVGLSLAVGVVVGRAAEPAAKVDDPLAKLERASATSATPQATPEKSDPPTTKVEVSDLSFPNALSEDEDRPEVLAALRAARAEADELAAADAKAFDAKAAPKLEALAPVRPAPAVRRPNDDDDDDEDGDLAEAKPKPARAPKADEGEAEEQEMVASIPAAVAVSSARNLRKAARRDPLVAAAVHGDDAAKPSAPHGHDGEYTLQIISNDRPEPSRAFAEGLREKGHAAFVTEADLGERGKFYRVRIGPFKTREQADAYRHKFEEDEHMNTFVVHEKVDKP